jgi:hypothetical protein
MIGCLLEYSEIMFALRTLTAIAGVIAAHGVGLITAAPANSEIESVLGTYNGSEPAFTDDESELSGPCTYAFHLLPNGRGFMDWSDHRTGKSGRTFGDYTIDVKAKEVRATAHFIPGMDSAAVESPATDYFSTFILVFSGRKVTARQMDSANAPTFSLSRVRSVSVTSKSIQPHYAHSTSPQ